MKALAGGDLPPIESADVTALAKHLTVERYAGGMGVGEEDSPVAVRIVYTGAVELLTTKTDREATVRILRQGDVMGDVEVLLHTPATTRARALRDSVLLAVDPIAWRQLIGRRANLNYRWFVSMAQRISYLEQRLGDLLAGDLETQLASLLLRECGDDEIRLSQASLARLLGVQRSSINRVLRSLESRGVIEIGYRRLHIRDSDLLEKLVHPC
jgi:CRP-like cAMP-binding protein